MKLFIRWILKKSGIYDFIWCEFCKEYPVRISGKTPEFKQFMEANNKAFTDMMIYGMGCTQHVDPQGLFGIQKPVVH